MNGLLLARLGEDTMRDVDCQSLPLTRRHNTTLASRRRQEPGATAEPACRHRTGSAPAQHAPAGVIAGVIASCPLALHATPLDSLEGFLRPTERPWPWHRQHRARWPWTRTRSLASRTVDLDVEALYQPLKYESITHINIRLMTLFPAPVCGNPVQTLRA